MSKLYFNPEIVEPKAGDIVEVGVFLDTQGEEIDGVDIIIPLEGLTVEVIDHHLLPITMVLSVTTNKIIFSQVTAGGTTFKGLGKLFTMKCTATVNKVLAFMFTPGSTIDTNVAAGGFDVLTDVGVLAILIKDNNMINPELLAELKALADKYDGELKGTFTPNSPVSEEFDTSA